MFCNVVCMCALVDAHIGPNLDVLHEAYVAFAATYANYEKAMSAILNRSVTTSGWATSPNSTQKAVEKARMLIEDPKMFFRVRTMECCMLVVQTMTIKRISLGSICKTVFFVYLFYFFFRATVDHRPMVSPLTTSLCFCLWTTISTGRCSKRPGTRCFLTEYVVGFHERGPSTLRYFIFWNHVFVDFDPKTCRWRGWLSFCTQVAKTLHCDTPSKASVQLLQEQLVTINRRINKTLRTNKVRKHLVSVCKSLRAAQEQRVRERREQKHYRRPDEHQVAQIGWDSAASEDRRSLRLSTTLDENSHGWLEDLAAIQVRVFMSPDCNDTV